VFVRELMTAYVDKSLLSTLPLQYRDYSNWFNQYLDGEEGAADQEYWASKLSTIAVSEYIKPDHQREQVMDAAAGNLSYEFSSEEHENFKNLAAQLGATPYQVYLTILSTLLHKISGENDIVIGSPVNGREGHPALASLIGYFINLVVLKTTVEGNETIVELLQNVKKEVLETQKHQRYPFERMTTLVESDRTSGRHPLFDVQVDFYVPENNAEAAFEKEGFSIEEIEAKIEESKFDVSILMTQNDDYTVLNFVYKKSLYDTSSIQFILDNFCRLLSNVVDNPALRLDQFTIFENEPSSSDESDESLDFNFKFQ
jgi:bacitracin synthase 3